MKISYIAASLASTGIIAASAMGVVSAASTQKSTNVNVGSSGIPRTIFKQDRLDAVAQVLNTSTANVQAAHKNKVFSELISNAGLTKKTFVQKVKAQFTTDLENQGYSQDQVTIALQHRAIVGLRHHHHHEK
jgi:hypothetical protein